MTRAMTRAWLLIHVIVGQHCRKSGAGVGLDVGHQGVSFYNMMILFNIVWNEHGTLNPRIQAGEGKDSTLTALDGRTPDSWQTAGSGVSAFGFHMI